MQRYVKPRITLVGTNGNPYQVMARTVQALQAAGYSRRELEEYLDEAMSYKQYHQVLKVTTKWVRIERRM